MTMPLDLRIRSVMVAFGGAALCALSLSCHKNMEPGPAPQAGIEQAFPNLTFNSPIDLQNAGDGTNRLFVNEQAGRIMVFQNSASTASAKVFLDIRSRVASGGEEGLLGLAFDPAYASNGYFYVNYTAPNPLHTVVSRFTVTSSDPDKADPNTEEFILQFNQPFSNHNGGQLAFGKDGFLYISTGDGGSGGDPQGNGQSLSTLLGKILRIDVHNPSGGLNYGIPADNPFAGTTNRGEIWAYGLRNPWRFSFDSYNGALWAGDVGQDAIEEIDIILKGKNYGWNIMEGNSCYNPSTNCNSTGLVPPIWEYPHSLGNAVVGGFVYRGTRTPELAGLYIFGDDGSGRIWALSYDGINPALTTELMHSSLSISAFGVDESHELCFCALDGKVYRFTATSGGTN